MRAALRSLASLTMEHWQFLIQKQGEHSWHPLDLNEEIIEGWYRVVARSNLASTDVEVRVTHHSSLELPPKRRIQRRSRRINSEGLVAVIPFTYLKPGVWELCCSGDVMSEFFGQSWQHSVQLQVLPKVNVQNIEKADRGTPRQEEEELPIFTDELPKQEAIIEQAISPVWLKGETVEQILQNLIELALPPSELPLEDHTINSPANIPEPPLALKLQQEVYVAPWGKTLTINGVVEQKKAANLDLEQISNYENVYAGEIRIELRSPHGSDIIRRVRQALPEKLIPFSIRCSIEIPTDCESKLILGEISLYGILTMDAGVVLLANQSFTITADVAELLAISAAANKSKLDTLKEQQVSSTALAISEAKKPSMPLDLKLFDLVKTPKKARSLLLQPSPKKSLPPRINPRALHKSAAISPQLPKFAHGNKMISPAAVLEHSSRLDSEKDSTVTTASRVINRGTTLPYLKRLKAQDETDAIQHNTLEPFNSHTPSDSYQQHHTTENQNEDVSQSVVDTQSQNQSVDEDVSLLVVNDAQSQNRPLPASSELITTSSAYDSPLIRQWMHTQGYSLPEPINLQHQDNDIYTVPNQEHIFEEETQADVEVLAPPTPLQNRTSSAWLAQEIVIDDRFDEAEIFNKQASQEEDSVSDSSVVSDKDVENTEPLPVPQLYLPSGELVCGQSVRVRVQLAQVRRQVAVKLWVEDCQTRWLIDSPTWLTNLLPNSSGGMEEITHINVPFGCLEIRLEAIAVDMTTQQESHKVTIQRTVMPPDLPTLQLHELLDI